MKKYSTFSRFSIKTIFKIFILLVVTIPTITNAQEGRLNGIVMNKEAKLLSNVNIQLVELNRGTTTDNSGKFSFNNLPDGKFSLLATHIKYNDFKKSVQITSGKLSKVNITLEESSIAIDEVIVSSTKFEQSSETVAMPLSIIKKETIERSAPISATEVLTKEAGINISRDGSWGSAVNVRGLSKQNVVMLVDGNRIETATALSVRLPLIDVNDIEKIEVIKGGVSSLYGSGATGGIINIFTKTPGYSNALKFGGSMSGSYNSVNVNGSGNTELNFSSPFMYAKVSGTLRSAENTETPVGKLENSHFRDNNLSAKIGLIPFDGSELKLNYQKFNAEDVGIPGGQTFPVSAVARYPMEERTLYNGEFKISSITDLMSSLSFKYFYQEIKREVELKPNAMAVVNPKADHKTHGASVQSTFILNNSNLLLFGIDAWQRSYDGKRTKTIGGGKKIIVDQAVPNSDYRSIGIYAHDELSLVKNKFKITFGGRYDFIKVTNDAVNNPVSITTGGNVNNNPPVNPAASYAEGEYHNESWSANVSLLYKILKNSKLTLTAARSFRSPTLEERFQYIDLGGTVYFGNPELDPEKGWFLDAGILYNEGIIKVETNVFINSFTDLVADEFVVTDSLYRKNNIGSAVLYGFDFSTDLKLTKNLEAYSTASFVRGRDTENEKNLAAIPPLNGRIGAAYNFNFVQTDLSMTYYLGQNLFAADEDHTPGFVTLNLNVSSMPINFYNFEIKMFAGVENILDKAYKYHLSTYRGMEKYEPGRNIYFKIKLGW